jgi:PAS domain S-box-containing protein
MFNNHLNRRILIGFVLALMILAVLAIYSFINTRKLIESSQWVAHTQDVLYHSQRLLAVAVNLEIGQRSYAMTGNGLFLGPFNQASNEIHERYSALRNLISDNDHQLSRLNELKNDVDALVQFSSSAVMARNESFEKAYAMNESLEGKIILDRIRDTIGQLEREEKKLLDERVADNENRIRKFNTSFIGLLLTASLVVTALLVAINFHMKSRNAAEARLVRAAEDIRDLYDNAPCGYHSLDGNGVFVEINKTLLKWLGYESKDQVLGRLRFVDVISEKDMKDFTENFPAFKERGFVNNVELTFRRKDGSEFPVILSSTAIVDAQGNFVKSRSNTFDNTERKQAENQILNLNKELEAFTYSVSHDLRAPLRSIDGYSRILFEDYNPKLDQEGKRLINVIVNNANRMGKLIDDLLDFSRLGRKDIQRTSIDMEALARTIAEEGIAMEKDRNIMLKVHRLHRCNGDIDMIRQVWINLISNAIKYSGRNPAAYIEIGSDIQNDMVHYYVKDNGVGFDMQYGGKLFGVFQRLHRIQDFSGTGVGLAIVKRIVNRHDGNVWADGQIDIGATFHFTIPINNGK